MLDKEKDLPVALLAELISLDQETGRLIWKRRSKDLFESSCRDGSRNSKGRSASHAAANWNSRFAGKPALESVDASGHMTGRIFNKLFYAHRVVFALAHGHWPNETIDHINGDPADNRPANLRDVSHKENLRNQRTPTINTSGHMGISFNRRLQKWAAHITVDGKFKHLGFFREINDAIAARDTARNDHGFHENHGRLSCSKAK